jgi:hypothetical protein
MIPPLIGLTVHERGASRRVCEERDRVTSRLFEAIKANQAQCSGKDNETVSKIKLEWNVGNVGHLWKGLSSGLTLISIPGTLSCGNIV